MSEKPLCMDKLRRCAELIQAAAARGDDYAAFAYAGWIVREARERLYEAEWAERDEVYR